MIFDRLLLGWSASAHRSWSREKQYQYSFVADDTLHVGDESNGGEGEGTDLEDSRVKIRQRLCHSSVNICTVVLTAILVLIAGSLGLIVLLSLDLRDHQNACQRPRLRREWRSLTVDEKHDFVQAVLCLSNKPSRWGPNGTMYDDFALLHGEIGSWSHQSVSFLPWHRYTLYLWEITLRSQCGYRGSVPYWDWSLDWMDLTRSSIWDSVTGFGGDGDPTQPLTVGGGRCVTDGPYSGLRPIKYNHTYVQHCLSRGFRDEMAAGNLPGEAFRPETVGRILRISTYKEFVKSLERDLHAPLHLSVRGDLFAMTGANDPIFFLHHAQLDRIWWRWQQENLTARLKDYSGKHMYNSTGEASLSDPLMFAGFTEDMSVFDVMDTQGDVLCYKY